MPTAPPDSREDLVRRSGRELHYYVMDRKRSEPVAAGTWLLAAWRCHAGDAPGTLAQAELIHAIRHGCEEGRYWLRAYVALPDRLALLLYPLEEPERLLTFFSALAGGRPDKCRAIETDAELERAACYVEGLPVRSHLAPCREEYPWSSAGWIHAGQH